jgi:prepilin signal peptidase PulO-like enzyme (type II secretory pathway)
VVEAVMGIVMMYIGYRVIPTVLFSPELTILYILFSIVFASLLLILTVYDIRHKVLPSVALYPLVVLSVVSMFVHGYGVAVPTLGDMLAGVLVSLPVFLLFFFSKGRAVGFADGVLLLGLGFVVGLSGAILGFFLSYWLALAYALPFLLTGTLSRKSQIPFAPFIIVAFSIVFVSGWGIDNLIALFTLYL